MARQPNILAQARAAREEPEAESTNILAQARQAQPPAGPVPGAAQPPADNPLAAFGLEDDDYARELLAAASATEDEDERRSTLVELSGYVQGRGRLNPDGTPDAEGMGGAERAGSRFETALRNFSQWSFLPVGDQVAALVGTAKDALENDGTEYGYRDQMRFQQGRRRGMSTENPAAAGFGGAGGLVSGTVTRAVGGLLSRVAPQALRGAGSQAVRGAEGVTRAVRQAPGVGRVARALDRTQAGRSAAGNVVRGAAQGGATAAGVTALEQGSLENVPEAALFGAVLAPVAEGGVRLAGRGLQAGNRRFFALGDAGLQGVLRRLDTSPAELGRRAQRFQQDNGRMPRLAELLNEEEAADISSLLASSREASNRAASEASMAATERQGNIRRAVQGSRRDFSPTQMTERRSASFDRFMQDAAETPVALNDDVANILADEDVRRLVSSNPGLRRRIAEATAADGDGQLSLRDMDTLRQITRDAAAGAGPDAARYGPITNAIRDNATEQSDGYGQAISEFRRRSVTREGYDLGRQVRSPSDVDEFNAQLQRADQRVPGGQGEGLNVTQAPGRAGARIGARQDISRAAQESPEGAAGVARSLEADEGFRQRLAQVFDVQEAGRMTRVGAGEARGARALGAITPRMKRTSEQDSRTVQTVIGAAVAAGGRASGAMIANVGAQIVGYVRGDQTRARQLAEALFDPNMAPTAIARLKQLGVSNEQITDLYREAARAAGIVVAQEQNQTGGWLPAAEE